MHFGAESHACAALLWILFRALITSDAMMVGGKDEFRVGKPDRIDDTSVEDIESNKIYETPWVLKCIETRLSTSSKDPEKYRKAI